MYFELIMLNREFDLKKKRNILDEELISDLLRVASILRKDIVTIEEYDKLGKFNSSSLRRRFGNWAKCLQKVNLQCCKIDYSGITQEDLLNDMCYVVEKYNLKILSAGEYDKYGQYNHYKIVRIFGSWNVALKAAGLYYNLAKNLTEEELFDNLLNIWQKLGRQPYYRDLHRPLSICSAKPYVTKYGSWYNALEKFVDYMNKDEVEQIK